MKGLDHFMTKEKHIKHNFARTGHCGYNREGGRREDGRLWILDYPGIPQLPLKKACPCCMNVVREGSVRFI